MTRSATVLSTLLFTTLASAQHEAATGNDVTDKPLATPVMKWSFQDSKEPGPRTPTFPGFSKENTAQRFTGDGKKSALKVEDREELRFGLNETITLEAWVRPSNVTGAPYIIGKGRLGSKEFGTENQNYALRLQGAKGELRSASSFTVQTCPAKRATGTAGGRKTPCHRMAGTTSP